MPIPASGEDSSGGFTGDARPARGGPPAAPSSSTAGASSYVRSRPCDTCRVRKTRCVKDPGQQRCVLCTFHDQPCTFVRGPTPRQRRPAREREREAQGLSQEYQGTTAEGEALPEVTSPNAVESPASRRSLQDGSPAGHSPQDLSSPANSRKMSVDAPRPKILSNTLGLDLHTHGEYVGPTDYRDPVLLDLHRPRPGPQDQAASARPAQSTARRLDHRTTFLVHSDESTASEAQRITDLDAIEAAVHPLGRTLVDLYFRVVHPSFPILHKDVFISKHRVSHRHFAPSLLAAVYLVALDWQLYDSSLAGRELESIPDADALEALAERTIAQDMRRPKLSTLEAGILLLQRNRRIESGSHIHPASSRMFTAQIVAMAQDLGIHIDCSSWSIPSWEVGLRRRLAWALYMQDRWGACAHGRPFLIQESDWDVEPCAGTDYPELGLMEPPNSDQVTATSTGWELFIRHIELSQLLSEVVSMFYSAKATRTGGTLDQMGIVAAVEMAKPLVFRLREWHAGLPPHLQMDNTNFRELCANGALHLAHVAVEITLHRALIRAMTPDTPEPLHDALRSTARTKVQDAIKLLGSLQPEHTAAFWGSAASYQVAAVGSLTGLLWATAGSAEEMSWCAARVEDLRWALRVRGAAAPFAREALRLIERDIGGLGIVKTGANHSSEAMVT